MNSGLCRGGPWNMKPLHHPTDAFSVVLSSPMKSMTYRQLVEKTDIKADVTFGIYRYRKDEQDWLWYPPKEKSDASGNR